MDMTKLIQEGPPIKTDFPAKELFSEGSGTTIMQDVLSYLGSVLSLFRKKQNTKEIPSIEYVDRVTPLDYTDPDVFNQWINLAVTDIRTLEEYCYTREQHHYADTDTRGRIQAILNTGIYGVPYVAGEGWPSTQSIAPSTQETPLTRARNRKKRYL